jgi:hypothetical protein
MAMNSPILAPAAALIVWSMLVLFYMIATRFRAFAKADIDLAGAEPGSQYSDVESVLPAKVNWVSHNYTHLMEQPTLFYAVVAVLALAGEGQGINLTLAWAYMGSRVVHTLWQVGINIVTVRVAIFAVSSTILLALAVNALRATL